VRFAILLPVTKNYKEHGVKDHLLRERVFQKIRSCMKAANAAGCEEENG
jgi:hypothetical protein